MATTPKRGQLLIELDATATAAEHAQADEALVNARLAVLRLDALRSSLGSGRPPRLAMSADLPVERLDSEQALARSQFDTYQARHHSLQASIAQRRAELRTTEATIAPLDESARISTARAQDYGKLVEGKYVGRHEYLLREQERIAAERDLATQRNRVQEIRSALSAAEEELRVLVTDTRQQTLDQLRQATEQVAQLTPEVAKTGQRDKLMALRAPVDGTVQQLAVHTVGGVVTPAQPLLAVVPSEEALEVEATVLNKDIGFVRAGQPVTVKIESFPYTRYGYVCGLSIGSGFVLQALRKLFVSRWSNLREALWVATCGFHAILCGLMTVMFVGLVVVSDQAKANLDDFGLHFMCPVCGRRNRLRSLGEQDGFLELEQIDEPE